MLFAGGMPFFDSVVHALSTAGTGGFSVKNSSIAEYNSAYFEYDHYGIYAAVRGELQPVLFDADEGF